MSKYIKLDEALVIATDYHNDDINAGLVESFKCLETTDQIRNLRKSKFGSYQIERRRRGNREQGLFEYRVVE